MGMDNFLIFVLSSCLAYILFSFFADSPKDLKSKKHRLPLLKYKNIEFSPYVRIHIRKKTYHLHHWITLTVITGITFLWTDSFSHYLLLKAAGIGGIIQGLRYKDRFKFWYPRGTDHRS